jgi:hypothetical protein
MQVLPSCNCCLFEMLAATLVLDWHSESPNT